MGYMFNRTLDKVAGSTLREIRRARDEFEKEAGVLVVPGLSGYFYGKQKALNSEKNKKDIVRKGTLGGALYGGITSGLSGAYGAALRSGLIEGGRPARAALIGGALAGLAGTGLGALTGRLATESGYDKGKLLRNSARNSARKED